MEVLLQYDAVTVKVVMLIQYNPCVEGNWHQHACTSMDETGTSILRH